MNLLWTAVLCAIALVVVKISRWLYRWSNPKCNGKLPPGSMGVPIIGETLDFYNPHGIYEISPFFKKRMLRYGPIFRTNVFGSKTVVSTDMDVNLKILRQENKSFAISLPDNLFKVLGKDSMLANHGKIHKHIKQIALSFIGPEGLKRNIVSDMDRLTREHLESKAISGKFDVKDVVSSVIVTLLTPKLISNLEPETQGKLMDAVKSVSLEWFRPRLSLHLLKNLFRTVKASRDALKMVKDAFERRKESKEKYGDFLDILLDNLEKDDNLLSQSLAESLLFLLSFASHDTTSRTATFVVKLVSEHPQVLAELRREHGEILKSRENNESGVTFEEYRHKMNFTNMVINEVLRLINIAPVLFRKAVEDVEIQGYTIPAGWTVLVAPPVVHHDPEVYEKPSEFNPWRWEGKDVRSGSKTFTAFGGGMRQCVGSEFARLQISIFLHYLVTNYNFSVANDNKVFQVVGFYFPKDLPFNISHLPNN